jgi:hypothetical protein
MKPNSFGHPAVPAHACRRPSTRTGRKRTLRGGAHRQKTPTAGARPAGIRRGSPLGTRPSRGSPMSRSVRRFCVFDATTTIAPNRSFDEWRRNRASTVSAPHYRRKMWASAIVTAKRPHLLCGIGTIDRTAGRDSSSKCNNADTADSGPLCAPLCIGSPLAGNKFRWRLGERW